MTIPSEILYTETGIKVVVVVVVVVVEVVEVEVVDVFGFVV